MANRTVVVVAAALVLAPGCWPGPKHRFVTDIKFSGTQLVTTTCQLEQDYPPGAPHEPDAPEKSCDEQTSEVTPMAVPADEVAP